MFVVATIFFLTALVFTVCVYDATHIYKSTKAAMALRKKGVSWKQAAVAGAIATLFGVFTGAASIYNNACGATLTDALGLTKDSSDQDNLKECIIAGTILAAVGLAILPYLFMVLLMVRWWFKYLRHT
jgi:hypothetical protein